MQPSSRDPIEYITLTIGAIVMGPLLFAAAAPQVTGWLLEHHVIVPAAEHPILVVPGADGAGFDTGRLVLAICGGIAVLAVGALASLRAVRRRAESGTTAR